MQKTFLLSSSINQRLSSLFANDSFSLDLSSQSGFKSCTLTLKNVLINHLRHLTLMNHLNHSTIPSNRFSTSPLSFISNIVDYNVSVDVINSNHSDYTKSDYTTTNSDYTTTDNSNHGNHTMTSNNHSTYNQSTTQSTKSHYMSSDATKPMVIGIQGVQGIGKSTLCDLIKRDVGLECLVLSLDDFYYDRERLEEIRYERSYDLLYLCVMNHSMLCVMINHYTFV